ncbi:putative iron-regulated membrane protein [Paenibacillus cellulosilyticus]|uniref:Putative iron-regulated membrane protein n=2 Tax=Paenibacillus cellulosilyticus TaxID=375489 RepID=A0A2V2YEW7_9BACL|nr:PepSY domain-containing protein [Paenibacillus cellulosilyticus]PWV89431.1 putative iron-regulated membrane protein [Paenibacillus cellulosilyticus]
MPFLILLAVTGGIYLFKDQIDDARFAHLYHIEKQDSEPISPSWQIDAVRKAYPNHPITSYTPAFKPDQTAAVGIDSPLGALTVFVNPYNGAIVGSLDPSTTLTQRIRDLHGSLMLGSNSIGDKIVEVAACWAIVLLISGIYLWWPRGRNKVFGTWLPRLRSGSKIMIRDLHAVPLFWLSIVVLMLVVTGLPWSGLTGNYISKATDSTKTGYPDYMWYSPESKTPTKDIMQVPWAAENLPVPESSQNGVPRIPIENVISIASAEKIVDGYTIAIPQDDKGVYTVSVWPKTIKDEATMHIDQYSGNTLVSLRYDDYGIAAKAIEIGISLHEGKYFGTANLVLCLLACITLAGTSFLGVVMWWRRRPKGSMKLGAPGANHTYKLQKGVAAIVIIMAILLPLVGITLIAALILDWLILRRIPAVRAWMN